MPSSRERSSASLARGAAAMTLTTAASRVTGLARVVVVAAAMGTTFLSNTYQTANTVPNVLFELVAAGVLTSVFVPTFVEHLVRDEPEEGWRVANVLGSVALVALVGLALVLALGAPLVMRALTVGLRDPGLRDQEVALGSSFLRLFAPQIIFYGAGMIMTGALHAHRRFALAAAAPIFNNVVVIAVYAGYAVLRGDRPPTVEGITTGETLLLGAGTTAGVVAMTLCLLPSLRRLGWRFRWLFTPGDPAVARAARLGAWALGYAGGYQAGLVVVLVLANRIEGGVAAYQWAYAFFYVPHALFAVPIFNALFPAMSEHIARGEEESYALRVRDGLAMLAFILLPVSTFVLVAASPLARVTLEYGVMSGAGAALVGRVLAAFALGLPAYSGFLALTRAFYALGDTRTPAIVNAVAVVSSSAAGAALFAIASQPWAVPALAVGHSLGFSLGTIALARALRRRTSDSGRAALTRSLRRSTAAAVASLVAMIATRALLPEGGKAAALASVAVMAVAGAAAYAGVMVRLRSSELHRVAALVRSARA